MAQVGAAALLEENLRLCEWFLMGLGAAEKMDANPELLNGGPHTVFKVWTELSSGHKCQLV